MKTIKFEDHGQDFLEWIVRNGVIIDCQPFQYKVWVGKKVRIEGNIILVKENDYMPVNYPVISITDTERDYKNGFEDGYTHKAPQHAYAESDQYRFGFNVAQYYLTLERKHASKY